MSRILSGFTVVALAVAADQLVKRLVVEGLGLGDAIEILPFLAIFHARNEGIAFSMLNGLDGLGLAAIAALVLVFVLWLWWNTPADRRLTRIGKRLVRLPVDPRMARMVLEADRLGCVHEVLVIAAAMSIQDPRERPADKQQAADEKHARFADRESDFVTLHVPESEDTINMISTEQLAAMKKGSYLINNARGTVVDIPAMIEASRSGKLAGAAIDVFPNEPAGNGDYFSSDLNAWTKDLVGLKNIILPKDNEKDLADIPKNVLDSLDIYMVETMDEVLKLALESPLPVIAATTPAAAEVEPTISDDTITH